MISSSGPFKAKYGSTLGQFNFYKMGSFTKSDRTDLTLGRHIYKNATTIFPTRPKYLYYASNNNWSVSENLNNMHAWTEVHNDCVLMFLRFLTQYIFYRLGMIIQAKQLFCIITIVRNNVPLNVVMNGDTLKMVHGIPIDPSLFHVVGILLRVIICRSSSLLKYTSYDKNSIY